ncbi:hypothetical protein Bca52824_009658 [Brassica carinata]|uniref:TORTIFOLIA1/SINE1-2 N-terminal domain-containing protein n=1 Tax=Brassica carinata TaxID=52824 RepID=A0A8X7WD24_BRACI|nr:hypothetical protein Bca52824_009658 [Brassica carinata]
MAKNSKQNMSVLLTKLGDRDTFAMAARELDSMARQIDPTASGNHLQSFISVILSADAGDKPAVRKHCIHLLAVLSLSLPPNSLSPFLPKILSRVARRLRDPDSSVRSACVAAVSAISSRTTKPPFGTAFVKPLAEALFTEQEVNAQIGAAMCLAAAIDAAEDPVIDFVGDVSRERVNKGGKDKWKKQRHLDANVSHMKPNSLLKLHFPIKRLWSPFSPQYSLV